MTNPITPSVIPPDPARLRIGDREIPVPPHPMSRDSRKRRHIEFVVTEPDLCVLTPLPTSLWGSTFVALVLCVLAAVTSFFAVTILKDDGRAGIIFGVVLSAVSVALLSVLYVVIKGIFRGKGSLRYSFDRASGTLLIDCRHGLAKEYRVESTFKSSDIVGIQLLYSGYHHISRSSDQCQTNEQFFTYEMNLLLSDPEHSRLHVCTHSDWQWMRDVGHKLSEFLGVPVVDQLFHGN